jgi:hypothetical protein
MGSASLPSHLLVFLIWKPPLGRGLVVAPPDMTFVRNAPKLSLLNEASIVAKTDLFGETAMTAG